jgi:hypothetical protein
MLHSLKNTMRSSPPFTSFSPFGYGNRTSCRLFNNSPITPVAVYPDAFKETNNFRKQRKIRRIPLNDFFKKKYIYNISTSFFSKNEVGNKVNGKIYIGSSSVDLGRRFSEYFRDSYFQKDNMTIYKAILKYGHSNFSFDILEECDPSIVRKREQYHLDLFKPEYNLSPIAEYPSGHRHSEDVRQKISDANRRR